MNTAQKHAIVFTGKSFAGKSTLAAMFAERHNLPLFAVGGFERDYAQKRGYFDIVLFEKEFGLEKAYYALIPSMLLHIEDLGKKGEGIVIEGVYDPGLYEKICALSTNKTYLVSITAPLEVRISRKMKKDGTPRGLSEQYLLQLDQNKERVGSRELAKMVNLTITNDGVLESAYNRLEAGLRRLLR